MGFPHTRRKNDSIWVIVDMLTKTTHFNPVKATFLEEDYSMLYLKEILRMHGVPLSIILDRGTQFTYPFSKALQSGLGIKVKLSTALNPQTDGLAEQTIQYLEYMLRECVIDFKGNLDDHLPLIKFAYNYIYNSRIAMAYVVVLYGWICRSPMGWFKVGEFSLIGPERIYEVLEKVRLIRDHLKMAQSQQKSYADNR